MVEWRVVEDDSPEDVELFESTLAEERAARTLRQRLRRLLRDLAILVLVVAMIAAFAMWRNYQENLARIRGDIQATVNDEAWAWHQTEEGLIGDLVDPQASSEWLRGYSEVQARLRRWAGDAATRPVVEVRRVEPRAEVALVEVLVTEPDVPWMTAPYRESRFYRLDEERWLRTSPDAAFWGDARSLDTEHFHFAFQERDAATVTAVAGEIDALYGALREAVGLGAPEAGEMLTVTVEPRLDITYWRFEHDQLAVPSPELLPVPEESSYEVRLRESLVYPLTQRVIRERMRDIRAWVNWGVIQEGAVFWLMWEHRTIPSAWRYRQVEELKARLAQEPSLRLNDLILPGARWVHIMAAETVVAYAVSTYGVERLPALLEGFEEHLTWKTLAPEVYGVSAEEFELGWRQYLATRYEVQVVARTE
jgi:hypothetical protein